MSFEVQPFIIFAALSALAAVVAIIFACRARNTFVMVMLVLLALLLVAPSPVVVMMFFPELTDSRYRTYKAFYRDIEVGMTREQVLTAMERRYPKKGPRQQPTVMQDQPGGLGFFMNPEKSREPNCEGIFLTLEAGRVTKKVYSPD